MAGVSTTGQPPANAGAILRVAIAAGQFHGVTSTAPPIGSGTARILFAPEGDSDSCPIARRLLGSTSGRAPLHS